MHNDTIYLAGGYFGPFCLVIRVFLGSLEWTEVSALLDKSAFK